jgi:hypothetical protein
MSRAIKDYNSIDWYSKFYYDPTSPTGLRWKVDNNVGNPKCKRKSGDIAGSTKTTKGMIYSTVSHKGHNYYAHRVIWIMHNGYLDNNLVVDHISGFSNNIENLRVVPQELNNKNAALRKDNSTGIQGVNFTTAKGGKGGLIKDYYTFASANWHEKVDGKFVAKCKHFSVKKLGLLPAFAMACKYREEKIAELNALGYGYTDNHGK